MSMASLKYLVGDVVTINGAAHICVRPTRTKSAHDGHWVNIEDSQIPFPKHAWRGGKQYDLVTKNVEKFVDHEGKQGICFSATYSEA